jgi:hypothetical protein
MVAQVRYSVAGWSRGRVVPCAVYTMHVEMRSVGFLVEPQNQGQRFVSGLAPKPLGRFLIGLGLKTDATVCEWFGLKTTQTVSSGLTSKPVAAVSSGLTSKPAATVSGGLASKPAVTVFSGLVSKPVVTVFFNLAFKLVVTVSPGLTSKSAVGFLIEPLSQGGGGFSGLGLKTGSSDLVIWASKSPQWFLGLCLKTKQSSVCRLRHKTNEGGRRGTHVKI